MCSTPHRTLGLTKGKSINVCLTETELLIHRNNGLVVTTSGGSDEEESSRPSSSGSNSTEAGSQTEADWVTEVPASRLMSLAARASKR